MKKVRIDSPGLLTTVQDLGRYGFQKYGVSVSGAMDAYSAQLANILVGNRPDEAALECTLAGPSFTFMDECVFSITGADMHAVLNGKRISGHGSYKARKGDSLRLQAAKHGTRTYVAFSGGIDVESVMGSKSTYTKAGFGGYEGRKLKNGDFLEIGDSDFDCEYCYVPEKDACFVSVGEKIRVVLGPEIEMFTEEGIKTFFNEEFELSRQCDRMGYRLDGPVIEHVGGADILSGGITLGAVQVPGHGHPIIMMADRQTTGGYSKIANVATVDIDRLAQMRPGEKLRFESVEPFEAQTLLRKRQEKIAKLGKEIIQGKMSYGAAKEYGVRLDGEVYDVSVREAIKE
jgi:biotin-dependent carboxylase-like uncharacterized protein